MKTVLIIDDEVDIVEFLADEISNNETSILVAHNQTDALKKLMFNRVDVVLSDVFVPGTFSKKEFVAAVLRVKKNAKVLFMSGSLDREVDVCDDYIFKPFDTKAVVEMIRKAAA